MSQHRSTARRTALGISLTTIAYFIAGKLGLMSAIPPGYATAVFPPAGIALVAVLLFGRPMAWGVWLGSMLMNVSISIAPEVGISSALALGGSIGLGAALQALISAELIRRFVREATAPKLPSEIFKFLILGAPVGCLFNSFWGVGSLAFNEMVLRENFFFSWFTWYVGDAIGVLIFAPLGLILLNPGYARTFGKRAAYAGLLVISYLFSAALYFHINESVQNRIVADFHLRTDLAAAHLSRELAEQALTMSRRGDGDLDAFLREIDIGRLAEKSLKDLGLEGIDVFTAGNSASDGSSSRLRKTVSIRTHDLEWPVHFELSRARFFSDQFWRTWRVLAFGMLFTGILASFSLTVLGRNAVLEREIESATKQVKAQRQKIESEARLSSLGQMAGGIAHEINNPLTIVLGQAVNLREMAEESSLDKETVAKIADSINNSVLRISRIVKGLKNVSRDGSRDLWEKTRLDDILEDALSVCREKFKRHSVDLQIANAAPGVEIFCRRVEIAQVVINLLSNAFDAVKGSKNAWVRVETSVLGENIRLAVTDSGAGIPEDHRDKIMEPFFTTKKVGEGTGLGLSISLGIAKSHGGDLHLQKGSGNTCFVLTLPLKRKA